MTEEQGNQNKEAFTKILKELEDGISKLPLESMITHENSRKKILNESLFDLRVRMFRCVKSLFIKGAFGDVDAIKMLRDTGIEIADALEQLADLPEEPRGPKKKVRSDALGQLADLSKESSQALSDPSSKKPSSILEGYELNLNGNFSSISKAAEKLENLFKT